MTALEDHPHGQQCVNGLYATFDPEFKGVSFLTLPLEEDDQNAIWTFTADWMGTETDPGTPIASGLVSVVKNTPFVGIFTWYPFVAVSIVRIFDE